MSVVSLVSSDVEIWHKMHMGANFCQVSRIMPDCRETPCVTSGTQKWNGARPNFIRRAMVINSEAGEFETFEIVHCPEYRAFIRMASMRIIDAVACVIKYLTAASVDRGDGFFIRMGMKASMFISNPIQAINQCELTIVISVPDRMVVVIASVISGLISTGRI